MALLKTLLIFILAGLCEIGGGYLVWRWLKTGQPLWIGLLGFITLGAYGWVMTWQAQTFARVYAAYGGIFILMSFLWAYKIDGFIPDKYDIIGTAIVLLGVGIIYYAPRH